MENKIWNELILTEDRVKAMDKNKDVATALGEAIIMFLTQDNVCKVYDDDYGVYVIQYEHDDEHRDWWGDPKLMWVTDEEYEDIIYRRTQQEDPQDEHYEPEEDTEWAFENEES